MQAAIAGAVLRSTARYVAKRVGAAVAATAAAGGAYVASQLSPGAGTTSEVVQQTAAPNSGAIETTPSRKRARASVASVPGISPYKRRRIVPVVAIDRYYRGRPWRTAGRRTRGRRRGVAR